MHWLQRLVRTGIRLGFSAQMAWHGVLANPLRSGLTILGVAIGVAAVISLMAIGEGARRAVVAQFRSLGANVIVVRAEDPSAEFRPEDASDLEQRVQAVAHATPAIEVQAVMRWRRARGVVTVLGVNEQFPLVRDHPLAAGRFFTSLHVRQRAGVAVLGYNVAAGLLGGRSPVGQSITLEGRTYRILGVLAPKGPGQADGIDDKVLIPYTSALPIARKATVPEIWAKAASPREADLAVAQLGRIFRRKMGLDPGAPVAGPGSPGGEGAPPPGMPRPGPGPGPGVPADSVVLFSDAGGVAVMPGPPGGRPVRPPGGARPPGGPGAGPGAGAAGFLGGRDLITITNLNQMVQQADKANRIMTVLLGGIAAVSLLVGGLGIMNIMLVAVTERTSEIGLRRALGATQVDLVIQFLIEALYLSGVGAAVGVVAGVWGSQVFSQYGFETAVSVQAVRTAAIVALGSGLLFGVYPAVIASSLPPAAALRR